MTPFALLLGLILPACGTVGARGLPEPPPMDMTHIVRPSSPNTALAAPAGFHPPPDIVTPIYDLPASRLYDQVRAMAATRPRTWLAAEYPDRRQVHYVVRSAVFNFPDLVTVQVQQDTADTSRLVLYSRSVYGYSDLGANRARVVRWLTTLQSSSAPSHER